MSNEQKPLNFDCVVCDKCMKPMTAKEYWIHKCGENKEVGIVAQTKEDKIVKLKEELDDCRYDLDITEDKISDLDREARDLTVRIEEIEGEIENLEEEEENA